MISEKAKLSGYSIVAVYTLRECETPVRFRVPRPQKQTAPGGAVAGSLYRGSVIYVSEGTRRTVASFHPGAETTPLRRGGTRPHLRRTPPS